MSQSGTPHSELKMFKCKNKQCNAVVGLTDGTRLYLLGKIVPLNPHYIRFDCLGCGETVEWRKRGDNQKIIDLNDQIN